MELQEVVVVGYSATEKKALSAAMSVVTVVRGKAAGVQVKQGKLYGPPQANGILRGLSSTEKDDQPLIIVDGVPFEGDLDPEQIGTMEVLKGEAATALYGSRAAGGVIIITTGNKKKGAREVLEEPVAQTRENSLRTNFKDYALWEPQLSTNNQGEATFELTLPDDITNWQTHIIAYGRGKRTGQLTLNTRSYLPISGRLAVPRFLIPGDSATVIGKVANYTGVEQAVEYSFYQNDEPVKSVTGQVRNTLADSILVIPTQANDTVRITYSIGTENGFTDGEQREIPVYEKGIRSAVGHFWALDADTTFTVQLPDSLGPIHLYASGDLKNVFLDEIEHLIAYKYECNEQLAFKLIALATFGQLNEGLGPAHKRRAEKIIRKLKSRQNENGFWGWWSESSFEPWVSEHVIRALTWIEPYVDTKVDFKKTIENAIWEVDNARNANDKLELITLLKLLDPDRDLSFAMSEVKAAWPDLSTLDKFTYWRLAQQNGTAIRKDSIMRYAEYDGYGNLYFTEAPGPKKAFYREHVYVTLKAYELLSGMGETDLTRKIVNYLLHRRSGRYWRHTYESSKVISTLKSEIKPLNETPATLRLSGLTDASIQEFPFTREIKRGGQLEIKKSGRAPIYLTAYQQVQLEDPKPNTEHFNITTSFDGADSVQLVAGDVTHLEVTLEAKATAEFLVVDIPIPASCSYGKKEKPYTETHREYYRDKVSIFFKRLPKGTYTYSIELIPRYSGSYTQNPAQAHWMYFPTISGWDESKRIKVMKK